MERLGDSTLDADPVRAVFAGDVDGQCLDQRADEGGSHGGLVRERATDLQ